MFRLFLPTIIRELRSLTKVTLVIFVYDGNGTQLPEDGWKKQPKHVGEL